MDSNQPNTILLCANYNTPEVTQRFIAHVLSLPNAPSVIVSDNDGSLATYHFDESKVKVYNNCHNPGYIGGCHLAYQSWCNANSHYQPQWVGIVNTDIVFNDDFFTTLSSLNVAENVGAIAPDIRLPSGHAQNPYLMSRIPAEKISFYLRLFSNPLLFLLWDICSSVRNSVTPSTKRAETSVPQVAQTEVQAAIYAPFGAAVFFTKSFFSKGGHFNYRGFLYQEEIFIAEQLITLGLRCIYMPSLKILHYESTTVKTISIINKCKYKLDSMKVIAEDYYPGIRLP